jgi:lysyl-tRNA synthetase class I
MYELFQSTFAVVQSSSRTLVSLYDHLTIAPAEIMKFLKKRVRNKALRYPLRLFIF